MSFVSEKIAVWLQQASSLQRQERSMQQQQCAVFLLSCLREASCLQAAICAHLYYQPRSLSSVKLNAQHASHGTLKKTQWGGLVCCHQAVQHKSN